MDYKKKLKINSKINKMIENDKNNKVVSQIFNICKKDLYDNEGIKNFSSNNNGIFFNINVLSDETLKTLDDLLNEEIEKIKLEDDKLSYSPYSTEESSIFEASKNQLSK